MSDPTPPVEQSTHLPLDNGEESSSAGSFVPGSLPGSLARLGWRYLLSHPWQSLLMLAGIMLGVAVMVSIDIANASASRAFDLSTDAVTGKATHQITGGPQGLPEFIYTRLRTETGWQLAAPVVQEYVSAPELGGGFFTLLGVDPFAENPFRNYLGGDAGSSIDGLGRFFTQPGAVMISSRIAERYGLTICPLQTAPTPNCVLHLQINGQTKPVPIVGLLNPSDTLSRRALDGILLTDISSAQELSGKISRLDQIDLIIPEGAEGDRWLRTIAASLPPGAQISTVAARRGTVKEMTSAFRVNLTALSLLALVVGLFLIYNTVTFSVVRRREMFGTLRCLGVTRGEVFWMVIVEALLVGLVGSGLGVIVGVALGQGAVKLVSQSINDLFFVVTIRGVQIPVASLIKGGLAGLGTTTLAVLPPAWEAACAPPRTTLIRSRLEDVSHRLAKWIAAGGLGLLLLGGVTLAYPTRNLVVSFIGTFEIILGTAMLTPQVTIWIMRLVTPGLGKAWGVQGRMASRGVVNALSRTGITIAALMIAVSVTIGVSLMISSFRFTVATWLDQVLQGDVYISVPGATGNQSRGKLRPEVITTSLGFEGVASGARLRATEVDSPRGPVNLTAVDDYTHTDPRLFLQASGSPADVWEAMQAGGVVISEPLSSRLGLDLGDFLPLFTAQGAHNFPIVGVFYDYSSPQGSVRMALDVYQRNWKDPAITGVALFLSPETDVDKIVQKLQFTLKDLQTLEVQPSKALQQEALDVFDRTFTITQAMQLLTILVAFIGVVSALMALQLERRREMGILSAMGMSKSELFRLLLMQSGLMGAVSGLLALPTGYLLALILVYIINKRSFGWTLQLQVQTRPFWLALVVAILAALLAGVYPAFRLRGMSTVDALKEE